jgi:hypothetical protein
VNWHYTSTTTGKHPKNPRIATRWTNGKTRVAPQAEATQPPPRSTCRRLLPPRPLKECCVHSGAHGREQVPVSKLYDHVHEQLALGTSGGSSAVLDPSVEIRRRSRADAASRVVRPQLKFAVRHQRCRLRPKAANRGAGNCVPSGPR